MRTFLERVHERPLLGDGAMGTLLYARGISTNQCLEALVIEQPALIAAIHHEYACAGADMITTHSFGANRMRLEHFGLVRRVRDFNLAAVQLAQGVRLATQRDFLIAGNVGPVGKRVVWADPTEATAVAEAFGEQIDVLASAGVDLLLFETFSDVNELCLAVRVAKELCTLPIVASMSYGEEGRTLARQPVADVTKQLLAAQVDVIGANCSVGPGQMVETVRVMREIAPNAMLSVTPNAGLPVKGNDGQLHYPVTPAQFAGYTAAFLALGARLIGGCCGTTPEHIAAMRGVLG
jgi:homocysteine S-methyltransferase